MPRAHSVSWRGGPGTRVCRRLPPQQAARLGRRDQPDGQRVVPVGEQPGVERQESPAPGPPGPAVRCRAAARAPAARGPAMPSRLRPQNTSASTGCTNSFSRTRAERGIAPPAARPAAGACSGDMSGAASAAGSARARSRHRRRRAAARSARSRRSPQAAHAAHQTARPRPATAAGRPVPHGSPSPDAAATGLGLGPARRGRGRRGACTPRRACARSRRSAFAACPLMVPGRVSTGSGGSSSK